MEPGTRKGALPMIGALVFVLVSLLLLAGFAHAGGSLAGFPLDDAWIHQVVARTFATTGTLGYAQGQHGAGATSYFWALILSTNYKLVHANPVYFTFVLNTIAYVTSLWFVGLLFGSPRGLAKHGSFGLRLWFSVLFAGFGANYLWFAYSGMEALPFVSFSAGTVLFFSKRGSRSAVIAGSFAAALALTRPEAAPLGLLVALLHKRFGRPARETLLFIAPWGLAMAAYVGSNLHFTGHAAPATLSGRRWLWTGENLGLPRWMHIQEFVDVWMFRLREYSLGTSSLIALYIALGLSAFGLVVLARRSDTGGRVFLLWALFHVGFYVVMMPSPGHGGRYQPLVPLLFMLGLARGTMAAAAGIYRLVLRRNEAFRPAFALLAMLPWVALTAVGVRDFSGYNQKATAHIQATEMGMGAIIDALPPSAKVASFDIGGSGFSAHRAVFDIGGLSNAKVAEQIKHGRIRDVLRDNQIDYVIVPETYERDMPYVGNFAYRLHLKDNPELILSEEAKLESPKDVWGPGIAPTWNASPLQVMYRVKYTNVTAPVVELPATGSTFDDGGVLVSDRERARIVSVLSFLPPVELPTDLALRRATPTAPEEPAQSGTLRVTLGKNLLRMEARPQLAQTIGLPELEKAISTELQAYFKLGDVVGAARLVPHLVVRAAMTQSGSARIVLLPPAREPRTRNGVSEIAESAYWGAFLAFAVFVASAILVRLSAAGARTRR